MTRKHWSTQLEVMGACSDAVDWARTQPSLAAAWRNCKRGDWMLWLAGRRIGKSGSMAHRRVVQAAAKCARMALPIWHRRYPDDVRPKIAILAAERWSKNPTEKNRLAADVAAASAYVGSAAAYAAAYAADAADAAAAAAYAAYAADAAAYAAYAAAAYAAYAAAAYAAYAAARSRSLARSAAIVRRIIPTAPRARR